MALIFFQILTERHLATVTSDTYIEMLNTMFTGDIYADRWFQQDGATAHGPTKIRNEAK